MSFYKILCNTSKDFVFIYRYYHPIWQTTKLNSKSVKQNCRPQSDDFLFILAPIYLKFALSYSRITFREIISAMAAMGDGSLVFLIFTPRIANGGKIPSAQTRCARSLCNGVSTPTPASTACLLPYCRT